MVNTNKIFSDYIAWLQEKTRIHELSSGVDSSFFEIETPFINHLNDTISIFLSLSAASNTLRMGDNGRTLDELYIAGVEISNSPRRQAIIRQVTQGFGVKWDSTNGEIFVETTIDDKKIPLLKHSLIQTILAIYDLVYLSVSRVVDIFTEDVERYLSANSIRHIRNVKFTGKTGLDHTFDFIIPGSQNAPERFLQALGSPRRDRVENILFKWLDTIEERRSDSKLFVFLNDTDQQVDEKVTAPLASYSATAIPWSRRQDYVEELVA